MEENVIVPRGSALELDLADAPNNADVAKDCTQSGPLDFFKVRDGVHFAGSHLIIDLFEATRLDDIAHIEKTLLECVERAGATLLHIHLHNFEPNGGISGVAVLAESHISIHSWPENGYAALDVFMCGDAEPEACIPVLREAFKPARIGVEEHMRGKGVV